MFTSKQVVTNGGKAGGVNIRNVTGYTIGFRKQIVELPGCVAGS